MRLLNRRKSVAAPPPVEEPVKIAAANWTRGQQLATTAARVGLWALIACAPLGLAAGGLALATARTTPQAIAAPATTEPPARLQATGIAEQAVLTWLGASRDSADQVKGLLPSADLPAAGLQVSAPGVVESVWDGNAWVVTVGVTITSAVPAQEGVSDASTITQRRFFQVPVAVDAVGQLSVLMLPSEVAGPAVVPQSRGGFTSSVPSTHPVAVAASEFLSALLAGGGDVARYSAPESQIRAVVPAPYSSVFVESVKGSTAPPEQAGEGDSALVLVRVRAENDTTGAVTRFDYLLAMTVRSSRWEITEIKGSPAAGEEVPTADPAPSPIPTTTNP